MRTLFFLIMVIIFTSCGTYQTNTNPEDESSIMVPDSIKAIGIWQVPKEQRTVHGETNGTKWVAHPNPDKFIYDGTYVTIMLITIKDWMWRTPDDLYKLKSKWSNDTLFYLPPFGRWTDLAIFKDNTFYYKNEIHDSVYTWSYKKITAAEIDKGYEGLIKQRKAHDYSIQPMDKYEE